MRQNNQYEAHRTFDSLSHQQLLIYARELGECHQRGRDLQDTLSQRETQIQEMAEASCEAQKRERQSIAFEVHDRIAQSLVSVFQQLQVLESMTRADSQMGKVVARASGALQEAIHECRNIMNDLHSPSLKQYGIVSLIKEELRRFQRDVNCRVMSYTDYQVTLSPDVEMALYRIFQEALMNIRRHAPSARNVVVSLRCRRKTVSFQVHDDGPGFDAKAAAQDIRVGGITSMRRRAEAIGGSLEVTSFPGYGARVTAYIPVTEHNGREASLK
ncbi:MAG: ATP-binding protein [Chloroflexota bacterium]